MKRSDTLFRHRAHMLYETGASIKEMVFNIMARLGTETIEFEPYADEGICERVGTWIMDNDGENGVWALFTRIERDTTCERLLFTAEVYDYERTEDMYDYSLDELIYLHDEIEKIYKAVKGGFYLAQ